MDDWLCLGALHAIGINVGHHIVPHQPFTLLGNFVVDVILMCFQLGDLLICDLQAAHFQRAQSRAAAKC